MVLQWLINVCLCFIPVYGVFGLAPSFCPRLSICPLHTLCTEVHPWVWMRCFLPDNVPAYCVLYHTETKELDADAVRDLVRAGMVTNLTLTARNSIQCPYYHHSRCHGTAQAWFCPTCKALQWVLPWGLTVLVRFTGLTMWNQVRQRNWMQMLWGIW